ncbi:hypothetical protein ACER0C_002708 [Sarotherodon galilaeus]
MPLGAESRHLTDSDAAGGLSTLPPHSREYHFVNQMMTWTEAQSYCREHFTDLVTIYNSDINQLLVTMAQNIDNWAWTGLYDDPYSWKWSMEGKLFYVGSTHEFLIWANGQPDCVNAKEYCVALQGQTQMNDRPCGDSYPFLCYNVTKQTVLKMKLQSEADMHSTEIQQQVSQQLSGLMLSEGLTDFRIRWRKVQSYHDDQSKKQDVDAVRFSKISSVLHSMTHFEKLTPRPIVSIPAGSLVGDQLMRHRDHDKRPVKSLRPTPWVPQPLKELLSAVRVSCMGWEMLSIRDDSLATILLSLTTSTGSRGHPRTEMSLRISLFSLFLSLAESTP